MRHRKRTLKLNNTSSHNRCLFANMLKSLIENEKIVTTVPNGKWLKRFADKMVTLAKENTLASRRRAIAEMMVRFNELSGKEARAAKGGDLSAYNTDRKVIGKLFNELGPRFATRNGGYTRLIRLGNRVGDNAETCIVEYLGA